MTIKYKLNPGPIREVPQYIISFKDFLVDADLEDWPENELFSLAIARAFSMGADFYCTERKVVIFMTNNIREKIKEIRERMALVEKHMEARANAKINKLNQILIKRVIKEQREKVTR